MVLRVSAIAVFVMALGALLTGTLLMRPATVHANDFAKRFIVANPPKTVPLFQFEDDKGIQHDLREYKGRYILLNLWATWCGPCVNEMPALNALQDKFDYRQMNVIALNEDRNGIAAAQNFYTTHSLKRLPIYADAAGRAPSILHASGFPVTLLIDPQGLELGRIEGEADWTSAEGLAFLKEKMTNF